MENASGTVGLSGSAEGENEIRNDPSEMGWIKKRVLDDMEQRFGLDGRLRAEHCFSSDGKGDIEERMETVRYSVVRKLEFSVFQAQYKPSLATDRFIHFDDIPEELISSKQVAPLYYPRIPPRSGLIGMDIENVVVEDKRLKYMEAFLQRDNQGLSLDDVVKFIQLHFPKIVGYYNSNAFPCSYNNDSSDPGECYRLFIEQQVKELNIYLENLAKNIVFVIELFLTAFERGMKDEMHFVFSQPWEIRQIQQVLIMATNQLPFFIFRELYNHAFAAHPDKPSFLLLSCHFFADFCSQKFCSIRDILSTSNTQYAEFKSKLESAKHFTDLVRTLQLPAPNRMQTDEDFSLCRKLHPIIKWIPEKIFTSLGLTVRLNHEKKDEENLGEGQGEYLYNVAVLREAGVKFRVNAGRNLCDIQFDENSGEMKIPPLLVDYSTELLFRNLMILELLRYPQDTYFCSYVFLMQFLIKSKEDVDLLIQKRIIINQLGSLDAVVTLFYDLCQHTRLVKNNYAGIFQKLNAYNAVRHHSWIAILKLKYFSNLWTGVATVAAIFLLALTLIQTICSIISLTP